MGCLLIMRTVRTAMDGVFESEDLRDTKEMRVKILPAELF
jgi:hypothetical protein